MSKEACSDLTHLRLIRDDVFLEVSEECSCELVNLLDVAEYRRNALGREHVRFATRFL